MQCLLCDGIRILLEVFQTTKSGTQSVRESGSCTWKHVQFEGASEDVGSQGEFYSIRKRHGMYTTPSQVRKKVENSVVLLILLPMNTTKVDVFHFVNEEVKTLVGGESMSLALFYQLWRIEFPHVQIPSFLRFSKCYHY
jgi:predicted ATP-dependent Lon-type protease